MANYRRRRPAAYANNKRQYDYIEGNTVRKFKVLEEPKIEERRERERRLSNSIRKNREKASHMNPGYVLFLAIAAVCTLTVCANYIQLQSDITNRIKEIAKLERELSNMKIENNAEYGRITSSVDLEKIKEIAINELGMVYANEEQVVLYEDRENEYMRKYADIPKSKK